MNLDIISHSPQTVANLPLVSHFGIGGEQKGGIYRQKKHCKFRKFMIYARSIK